MKRILIVGDSWGCGEWSFDKNLGLINSHQGLSRFLENGSRVEIIDDKINKVENFSKPASSNENTINVLKNVHNIEKYDYVIVFVTDHLRTIHQPSKSFPKSINTKDKLISLYRELEIEFYKNLSLIKNNNILLLGGLSKVNTNLLLDYENLSSPIPSIIEFIRPDIVQYDIYVEEILKYIEDNVDYSYITFLEKQLSIWTSIQNGQYFLFDKNHPDRNAHLLIYQRLKNILI